MQLKLSLDEIRAEALDRAKNGASMSNYAAILSGFIAKGIPASEIFPRENVFTFNAWKALGRSVKKGEHGVKITTFVNVDGRENEQGEESEGYRIPKTVTVFHISQTAETTEQQKQWDANRQARQAMRSNGSRKSYGERKSYYQNRRRDTDYVRDPGEDAADRWTESNR